MRELELSAFVHSVRRDPPDIAARRVWLHSRWYTDDDFLHILDAAAEVSARVTFCFLARDVPYRERVIAIMRERGHEIATHSIRHYPIDSGFSYEQVRDDLKFCIEQLEQLGVAVRGAWLSDGQLSFETAQAAADCGLEWFASGIRHDGSALPETLRFVPVLEPNDFEMFVLQQVGTEDALNQWMAMGARSREGVLLFHPFSLTALEPGIMEVWKTFVRRAGGSVPVCEWPDHQGRLSILFDASLRLHLI